MGRPKLTNDVRLHSMQVRVPLHTLNAIRAAAAERVCADAEIVRIALERFLEAEAKRKKL